MTFAKMPAEVLLDRSLTPLAVRIYGVLDWRAGTKGSCFPSRASIATDVGCSVATVWRALKSLADAGHITIEQRRIGKQQTSSVYTITARQERASATPQERVHATPQERVSATVRSAPTRLKPEEQTTRIKNQRESSLYLIEGGAERRPEEHRSGLVIL